MVIPSSVKIGSEDVGSGGGEGDGAGGCSKVDSWAGGGWEKDCSGGGGGCSVVLSGGGAKKVELVSVV
jgi:hypothetical protein